MSMPAARSPVHASLGIRPEHFERDRPRTRWGAVVSFVESLGGETVAYCGSMAPTLPSPSFDGRT